MVASYAKSGRWSVRILTICKHIAKAAEAQAQTKALSKSLQSQRRTKLFLKYFPTLQKKIKNAMHSRQTMKLKLNTDNGLQGRTKERQPVTAVWRNGGFSASYDSFVVGSSAVLRLNICAKNPPLRQAAKR